MRDAGSPLSEPAYILGLSKRKREKSTGLWTSRFMELKIPYQVINMLLSINLASLERIG
jgi:hypothetical protein